MQCFVCFNLISLIVEGVKKMICLILIYGKKNICLYKLSNVYTKKEQLIFNDLIELNENSSSKKPK